ncbi:probable ATP-dependent DNA helicase RecS [Mytilus trossulus]|uniref:probable ATP-dependent DNA helicase RecS n=1 Tax=Mytilus trossulus TaxID=6551 RepID=UPI003003BB3D
MAEQKLEQAIGKVLLNFNIDTLKLEQRKMLDALLSSKDCIGVLPTGYGKSLPYQMLVSIKRELGIDDAKVVVCSPLVALMQDQTQRLRNIPGIKAEYTGSSAAANENIIMGHFDYLFSSPEILVGDKDWREKLQRFKVSTIVVDEFHTIATWGEKEDESKQAFRKWFSYIGELRSLFPDASILALSATCTKQISKRVLKVLQLDPNAVEIRISPNKPNIKLVVNQILNTVEMAMCWLVDGLCDKALPKTMIYCASSKDAANIYAYISTEIPNCKEVQMFHSETSPDSKKRIMECLKDPTSCIKVVIATSALGMGIDMIGFSNVIIYGAPKTIVDLIQEIGRVGRDGKEAVALLLHNSFHLRDVETEVKDTSNPNLT